MKKTLQIIQFTFINIIAIFALSAQPSAWSGLTPTSSSGSMQGNVLINGVSTVSGDYIAAFGPTGNLVGVYEIQSGFFWISIYGNDGSTSDLMNPGEYFTLQVWDESENKYYEVGGPSLVGEWQGDNTGTKIPNLTLDGDEYINTWTSEINANTLLPIELGHFGLEKRDCNNYTIEWTTETEINNESFTVQRSIDDIYSFEDIAKIDGAGTSTSKLRYSYDDVIELRGNHSIYYRLKQTDFDGEWSLSNVIQSEYDCGNHAELGAYPNPFNTMINIEVPITETSVITVYDTQGKLVYTIENQKEINTIQTGDWPIGLYHINHYQLGKLIDSKKILKQH